MKAIQTIENGQDSISLVNLAKPKVGEGQVLVKLKAAALNRRDQWIREGLYPGIKPGVTLGSDGCGVVVEGDDQLKGQEVIINPNISWGPNKRAQSAEYTILGLPHNGTLAEYVVVDQEKVFRKPSHLSIHEAAALPLAGMTAFRAVFTRGEVEKGQNVLVTGAGGGVSQFAILFALAAGAQVFVTSGSDDKIKKMVDSGAQAGFNYKDKEWVKKAKGAVRDGFDAIIDSAGGDSLNDYIRLVKPGGNIVHYGATTGKPSNVDLFRLFWSQANIKGSTMATDEEFAQMVDFVEKHKLQPQVDSVYELEDFVGAFDRIKSSQHIGKIVLNIA
jgi:NADPH:quinone reductase-like Zn-dependent oxidoreductase